MPKFLRNYRFYKLFKIVIFIFPLVFYAANSQKAAALKLDAIDSLPDLGSSSSRYLSRIQAKQLGKAYIRQARASMRFINDPIIVKYINELGEKLVKSSLDTTSRSIDFEFYVVDSPQFNAFAVPSGQIVIHSGLIDSVESEDELAAVIAHEIAHVTQNHTARGFELSRYDNLISLASILAAAASGDAEIAQATVLAGTANSSTRNLRYSRSFEREADAIGVRSLTRAGYKPIAAASVLEKLNNSSRFNGSQAFEFLLSHPLTDSRISELNQRINGLQQSGTANSTNASTDINFIDFKARLNGVYGKNTSERANLLKEKIDASGATASDPALLHQYGLIQAKGRQYEEAIPALESAITQQPSSLLYQIALAEVLMEAKQVDKGKALFEKVRSNQPNNNTELINLYYSNALLLDKDYAKALPLLTSLRENNSEQPDVHIMLSRAYAEVGDSYQSYISRSEYHYLRGNYEFAIKQITNALELTDNSLQRSQLINKRDEIKRELQQIRKALK